MRRYAYGFLLGMVFCLPGCFALSIGGGDRQQPTMAGEIAELRRLRDRGTISDQEFETGKLTLLRSYRQFEPSTAPASDTQLATYPEPTVEVTR